MKAMKTRVWKSKRLLLVAALLAGLTAPGQNYERSRQVREAYKVTPMVEVQVVNKYGDIQLIPWAKDSVVFEINFSVTSKKQDKVDKVFDYIDFEFRSTAYYVIAQTVFKGQNTFWTEVADVAGTIFSSGTNTRIDYTVYYPARNDIKIENKFGNIYTTELSGKADIVLSNGDMKAHAFHGPARIKVDFGSISIDEIADGTLSLGYAEMNLEQAGALSIESRSSKIYISHSEKILLNSKRDRFYLKSVEEMAGELFFSYLNLDRVGSRINLRSNYGDIKLLGISDGMQRMDFNSQYSDITLYLDKEHLFNLEITRDDRSQVVSSTELISKEEAPVPGADKTFRARIAAGGRGKPEIPVNMTIKAGKVFLMEK